jgi:TonB family protein
MDSSGYYYEGLPDKDWIYPDSTVKVHKVKYYDKGTPLSEKEHDDRLKSTEIIDPAYPDFSRLSPESYFPGGSSGWLQYLNQNLHYPSRAIDNRVQGKVVASFRVEPTGEIQEIRILHSVELSIDDETIRLFMASPAWIPAIRFDRKLPSYKKQPVIFRLEPQ